MEIFRHYYTGTELDTNNFFKQHMNNFGFCNLDGSRITYEMANGYGNVYGPKTVAMRYKLDTKKQTYLYYNMTRLRGWQNNDFYSHELSDVGVRLSNGSTYYATLKEYQNDGRATSPAIVIFLPLKNNGFLLNIRSLTWCNSYWPPNPSTSSNNPKDKTFLINTPTPNLNIKIYGTNSMYGYYLYCSNGIFNLIGIPPCKGNSNWTYLLYTSAAFGNNAATSNYNYSLIDFGDGKVLDIPFKSNFIRPYNATSDKVYNELTYTNVNNNICSMIKLPYDNGYIDGVYLLTTAPQQLEDATFFSFDGRNFLNVFDNYVVELPPSTT